MYYSKYFDPVKGTNICGKHSVIWMRAAAHMQEGHESGCV